MTFPTKKPSARFEALRARAARLRLVIDIAPGKKYWMRTDSLVRTYSRRFPSLGDVERALDELEAE